MTYAPLRSSARSRLPPRPVDRAGWSRAGQVLCKTTIRVLGTRKKAESGRRCSSHFRLHSGNTPIRHGKNPRRSERRFNFGEPVRGGSARNSGCAGDVPGQSTTLTTSQCDLAAGRRGEIVGCTFDWSGAGRTAERRSRAVARNQMKSLRGIKGRRSRLAHMQLPRDYDYIPETTAPVRL